MKEVDILADEGDVFPDLPQLELFQIDSIEGDPSLDRVLKPQQHFDQGRFACTRGSSDSDGFPLRKGKIQA